MPKAETKTKRKYAAVGGSRPYNRYNIFFLLEREGLVLSKGGSTKWSIKSNGTYLQPNQITGYENIIFPPLPSRFAQIDYLPENWYISGQAKTRAHTKSHGVFTFREIARGIAQNWKTIDNETLEWCTAVEKILKQRSNDLAMRYNYFKVKQLLPSAIKAMQTKSLQSNRKTQDVVATAFSTVASGSEDIDRLSPELSGDVDYQKPLPCDLSNSDLVSQPPLLKVCETDYLNSPCSTADVSDEDIINFWDP